MVAHPGRILEKRIYGVPLKVRWWWNDRVREGVDRCHRLVPSWAALRTLGQSRVVGATMLVPFLGTVLLFNDAVLNAVRIPEELLSAWGVHIALTPNEASLVRLKLTYFGLCLVGVASF